MKWIVLFASLLGVAGCNAAKSGPSAVKNTCDDSITIDTEKSTHAWKKLGCGAYSTQFEPPKIPLTGRAAQAVILDSKPPVIGPNGIKISKAIHFLVVSFDKDDVEIQRNVQCCRSCSQNIIEFPLETATGIVRFTGDRTSWAICDDAY